jgi:hypothetical protein
MEATTRGHSSSLGPGILQKGNPGSPILTPLTLFLIVHIVSPLRKHGCFKLSVKMLLRQPCTLMEEEEEWTI